MKRTNLLRNITLGMVLSGFACSSCTDFDELNTDPTRMEKVNPGTLLDPILYDMGTYNWNRYYDYTFPLMQCLVSNNGTSGVGWWNMTDSRGDGTWNTYYKWINNAKEIQRLNAQLASPEPNYEAVSLTLQSWMYGILADAFGDIPMSEACSADQGILAPRFDRQEQAYRQILDNLKTANSLFDTESGLVYNTSGDMLYSTTDGEGIKKWQKFCNSLRMRTLTRLLDAEGFNAQAELQEMYNNPATYPVFESNDDAAMLGISGVFPEEAPMARPQDFTSYVNLSEFFNDLLNSWNDPRLPVFATQVEQEDGTKAYVGLPSGYLTLPAITASLPNQSMAKAPMELTLMSYAEVEFIKAELFQKGILPGGATEAETAYKKGVQASVEQWNATLPADYFDNPQARYDGSLERIMNQKFVALYFCDYQQWFEYNRTGYPVLPVGEGIQISHNQMPRRFKYPAAVQRTNMANYQEAKKNMGGDEFSIKLIWQK